MSGHQTATVGDTVYFWFAANDTSGSGGDGATPLYDVREAGAAAGAIPLLSGTPTLLSHANYPAGCYEIAVAATVGNGFAADDTFAVFCTLAIDSQNPSGFVGSCTLTPLAKTSEIPSAAAIVNEWETQSQADPTGFHVNVLEIGGTAQTANDNGADINTLITQVGTAGAGLTNLGGSGNNWNVGKTGYSLTATTGLGNQTANITGNLSGSVGSVTAGVSLAAGAVTNASLAGNMEIVFETDFATNYNTTDNGWVTNGTSFIGTGWNTDKTGYSLAADQSAVTIGTVTTNTDMRGTDNAALATALATAQTDLDTLTGTDGATLATTQANYAPAKAGDSMDVLSISGSATAADNLELSALTIIPFTVTGTPTSTEVAATGLTAITGGDDTIIGRVIIFTSGNAQYEAGRITDYVDATGAMTVTTLAVVPSATDTGIII